MLRAALIVALSLTATLAHADEPAAAPAQPAAPAPAPAAAPAAPAPVAEGGWIAEYDRLWLERGDAVVLQKLYKVLQAQLKKDDADFEANWRLSAWYNWDANTYPDGETKKGLARRAWTVGDNAAQARPEDVRGQYNGAVGIGLYSEAVGILNALAQGLEGKFKSRVGAAIRIDKDYEGGAPQVLWGRYFYKLPWPKRDIDESIKILTAAVAAHPKNLRAKWYLAESLMSNDKKAEVKKLAEEIAAAPLGQDPAEDKKVKSEMEKWMAQHKGDF
jgi:hypothetical protein